MKKSVLLSTQLFVYFPTFVVFVYSYAVFHLDLFKIACKDTKNPTPDVQMWEKNILNEK